MVSIFSDYIEHIIEVFMDDFTVNGDSFDNCLHNLTLVLQRFIETNLVLNSEKCHFMVEQGIVLGHVVSSRGIKVDKAKVDTIQSLPYPTSVREVCSFLGPLEQLQYENNLKSHQGNNSKNDQLTFQAFDQ